MDWKEYVQELTDVVESIMVTDAQGQTLDVDTAFAELVKWVEECIRDKRRVYFVGNGASASMASHFATDLAKMAGVPTEVFTDVSLITATANDYGYEKSFSEPLSLRMVEGEALVAISSSGDSPNVVSAVKVARSLGGRVLSISAMKPDNALRSLGDVNLYIDAQTYGLAESGHAAILHHLIDLFGVNTPSE